MRLRRLLAAGFLLAAASMAYRLLGGSGGVGGLGAGGRRAPSRKNVLFMITDDMRAQLGCLRRPDSAFRGVAMHTPNLDRLAARSLLLRRAYVQYTLCCPSRSSMLTGRRPDVTGVLNNDAYWREIGFNFTTLPQYFKENGYRSVGLAKVFHKIKDRPSWTEYQKFGNPEKKTIEFRKGATWLAYTKEQNDERPLYDIVATENAIERLKQLAAKAKSGEEPFFLALGFHKPHVSFVCPEEYFGLYPLEPDAQYLPRVAWQTPSVREGSGMLNVTVVDGELRMADGVLREHRRAYFACISYIDGLVGRMLAALDDLGLASSTVVAFVADHGYHLGEGGQFGKNLLTDVATRVPMMIHVPGLTDGGVASDSVVEALDLYPTVAEAAGLPPPPPCPARCQNVTLCTQGRSLLALLDRPEASVKEAAFTQLRVAASKIKGYSMRTSRYRYTEYVSVAQEKASVEICTDPEQYPPELYDYKHDVDEIVNRASSPAYKQVKEKLRQALHGFIKESNGVSVLHSDATR